MVDALNERLNLQLNLNLNLDLTEYVFVCVSVCCAERVSNYDSRWILACHTPARV